MSCLTTSQIFKFSFIPFNVVLLTLSVSMIAIGAQKLDVVETYDILTDGAATSENDISTAFLVLAPMHAVLAVIGCLVAVWQTEKTTAAYFVVCVLLSCALMAVGICQLTNQQLMGDEVTDAIFLKMAAYNSSAQVRHDVTLGQMMHECCGARGYSDWLLVLPDQTLSQFVLPKSCCTWEALERNPEGCNKHLSIADDSLQKNIKLTSCGDAYLEDLGGLPEDLGIIGIFTAAMQFSGLVAVVLVLGRRFYNIIQRSTV